jgi:AmmeMemoRadiSam system protein A
MLKLVREAIKTCIKDKKFMEIKDKDTIFDKNYGVFVTLNESGQLRGCVGLIEPIMNLRQGLIEMACSAALNDSRFSPVNLNELDKIDIEISILSENKKIKSPDEIVMGKDGVIVKEGNRTGLFLPQVATETGWSRDEFLSELCEQKAGLARDAWKKDKNLEMYIFTVYAFSEKDLKK